MCAREKRQGKMSTFTFPASSTVPRPSWWTNTSYPWETTANAWIATVGSMFDIEVYGSNFFQIDSRLISAKQAAEGESATKADVAFFPAARKWARNLKEAMQRTSVPSPYAKNRHWMLLSPENSRCTASVTADHWVCRITMNQCGTSTNKNISM